MKSGALSQYDKDARYRIEYEAFFRKLPPEQQKAMKAQGLDKVPNDFNLRHKEDDASEREDLEDAPQTPQEYEPTRTYVQGIEITATHPLVLAQVKCALRIVAAELLAAKNKTMWAECFSISTKLGYMGASEAAVARRLGVKRAAVSKTVKQQQAVLGLQPTGPMRKLTTCVKYARRAFTIHARHDGHFI